MILNFLIMIMFMISHVASHGQVILPKSRNHLKTGYTGQGCYVNWQNFYLQGFSCDNVCGNGWNQESGKIDPEYENTGPVVATYKMGQTIEMKFDQTGHGGYTRIRLCKLSSPSDRVTQKCLDENLLEITSVYSTTGDLHLRDKFTMAKKWTLLDATIQVKLPDGLACESCVLQWEWITTDTNCMYANGSPAPNDYCLNQVYKNCIDIKIENDPARPNQIYKSNSVQSVYGRTPAHEPVFWSLGWDRMRKDASGKFLKPANDPLKFIGDGLVCFADGKYLNGQAFNDYTKMCRENCMSPEKKCPDDCLCRWFEYDPLNRPPAHPLPHVPVQDYWAQCDGVGYNGLKDCGMFAKCVFFNAGYSQCQPI